MTLRVQRATLREVDLPFRLKFKHAAAERTVSESLFLELQSDDGRSGWGESLPRAYVTGEARAGAFDLLAERVLPQLTHLDFESFEDVESFLIEADGQAPSDWVAADTPQSAAWACVDLALLDLAGHAFGRSLVPTVAPTWRYSGVLTSGHGWSVVRSALKQRIYGLREIKVKIDASTDRRDVATIRRCLGSGADLRADANMAFDADTAIATMQWMRDYGFRSFEQPLPADDVEGAARVVRESGLDVMADESFSTRASLERLIEARAATALSVRISKCGGLVASRRRAREALDAGLWFQVGCQVGESSLLSAAQMALLAERPEARYVEGAFGTHLLEQDPVRPALEFGRGGRPPKIPAATGFGVNVDAEALDACTLRTADASRS